MTASSSDPGFISKTYIYIRRLNKVAKCLTSEKGLKKDSKVKQLRFSMR